MPVTETEKRHPCGFCSTGHHTLCPGSVRNGSHAPNPVWTCPCSEQGHTLGAAVRDSHVERLAPEARPAPRPAADTTGPSRGKRDGFPEGVCSPVQFRHLMVAEQLVPGSFRPQTVYTWVTQAKAGRGGFPVRFLGPDQSKPGVQVDQAREWVRSRQAAS